MAKTDGTWTRINDLPLGLGLRRFTSSNDQFLWRFEVTGLPGRKLAEFDADIKDLRKIATWCEQGIKMLQTDGDRHPPNAPGVDDLP